MSSITYSGYLYKRSNHPHRNVGELQGYGKSVYDIDPITAPELPDMPGTIFDAQSDQHSNYSTAAVTPSPAHLISTPNTAESIEPITLRQQSAFSPPRLEQKKNVFKNPIQQGLELGAAFFGIDLKKNNIDDAETAMNKSGGETKSLGDASRTEENFINAEKKKTQSAVTSTAVRPLTFNPHQEAVSSSINIPGITKTARRPIPTNNRSSSDQDCVPSFHDSAHPKQPASALLSESPLSFDKSTFNSSSTTHTTGESIIPQDFYDPQDGHLWRAKFCVLEDGILYFYRHANDGNSPEAAAEREKSKHTAGDDHYINNHSLSRSYNENATKLGSRISTNNPSSIIDNAESSQSVMLSRRRSSAKDLSKSPMVRPGLHPLTSSDFLSSDKNTCIWEKRVFMDCVGGVRTAEQQYGHNSFELLAMDDGESDQDLIDTLILKGQNPTEMKEWIFQFHRSLASFMRNFIDVVGSTSSNGDILDDEKPSGMLLGSRSSRHLSSSSLVESGSMIPQSSSEKHLQRLVSTSPSLHQTLSHGHGRITLKRRIDIKRTTSESVSLSSTPETSDMDYGHHPFAFREPSPSNLRLSPESSSPPLRVLIPPPVQGFIPAVNTGNFKSIEQLKTKASAPESSPLNDALQSVLSKASEINRPKSSDSSGKYIPPHQRNKPKYIPPHLRRQQDQEPSDNSHLPSLPPSIRKSTRDDETNQNQSSDYSPFASVDRSQFDPIKSPIEQQLFPSVPQETCDRLDILNPSTTGFVRGGCADPLLIQGSILDKVYIPKKASRLNKTAAEAYGSYGGSLSDDTTDSKSSLRWEIGAISECGVRESNEDAYLITNDLLNAFDSSSYGTPPQTLWKEEITDHSVGLFGIFDGHCGNQGARFAVEQLERYIHDELRIENIQDTNYGISDDTSSLSPIKMESILRKAIVKLDVAFCNLCQEEGREWESGATALVAMLANENLVIASLGDCRGFICRSVDDEVSYLSDNCWEPLEMDTDTADQSSVERSSENGPLQHCFWKEVTTVHSPSADIERTRIENANGWITTETEIPIGQLRRMDFHDQDVIGILKRCLRYPSSSASFTDSERSMKECKAAPQRIIHISRVCGELAVSRALGDRDFKADFNCPSPNRDDTYNSEFTDNSAHDDTLLWESPLFLPYPENHNRQFRGDLVSNKPDFHHIRLGTKDVSNEFLLLACDGLWDVMDADDAIRVVRDLLFHKRFNAKKAAARLAELAIHLGSSDNITVILLRFCSRDDVDEKR